MSSDTPNPDGLNNSYGDDNHPMGEHYIKLKNAHIMMVDDEPIMMELVQAFLEEEGYSRFSLQSDSRKALDQINEQRPDVVLLDLNMPEVNGFDILKAMGETQALRYIPVVVLTSSNEPADKLTALELGATDFLAKPVDPSELVLRLRNTLTSKAYQDQLAYYDSLTGLPNRSLFLDRLDWTLSLTDRSSSSLAVIDICLDRFKHINQALGIKAGDELLKQVSARLLEQVRLSDVVSKTQMTNSWRSLARFGGDEFSILLTDMTRSENTEIVMRRLMSVFEKPFVLQGRQEVSITASIGAAVYPEDGTSSEQLIKRSGAASAFVKKQGGNGFQFFSDEVDARSKERVALESDLRRAIGRGEFEMHYQPKVDARTQELVGIEALLRWRHSTLGFVSPVDFIPMAEEIGFIHSLGDWVILTVCRQVKVWRDLGFCPATVSLNVSPQQLVSGDLPAFLQGVLDKNSLPEGVITLELTESLAMNSSIDGVSVLNRLKQTGVNLSIDDFGTGYSNLGYLKQLPFDELKIDRSFLSNVPGDRDEAAIVAAINSMAKSLGLSVVAEGVETIEQLDFLKGLNVDVIQGYYFAKPMAADDLLAYSKAT